MKARTRFKKIGYSIFEENENEIVYLKDDSLESEFIIFFKEWKSFLKADGKEISNTLEIDMQELKAINKQVEELGW